jgi:hypothetical protein
MLCLTKLRNNNMTAYIREKYSQDQQILS